MGRSKNNEVSAALFKKIEALLPVFVPSAEGGRPRASDDGPERHPVRAAHGQPTGSGRLLPMRLRDPILCSVTINSGFSVCILRIGIAIDPFEVGSVLAKWQDRQARQGQPCQAEGGGEGGKEHAECQRRPAEGD